MNKTGKAGMGGALTILVVCAIAMVGILGYAMLFKEQPQTPVTIQAGTSIPTTGAPAGGATNAAVSLTTTTCPDDKDTSLKIDIQNVGNESSAEGFDETVYVFKKVNGNLEKFATISDTTTPTATTVDCGAQYVAKSVAASGATGDSSLARKIYSGAATINSDGDLEFTTSGSSLNIVAGYYQHSIGEVRAYDNINKALMYDSADASNLDFETDAVTFESTSSNTTNISEGDGLDIEFEYRAVQTDENVNDRGILVLLEAPATTWNTPTVYVNGQALTNIKGSGLNADEVKAYADYEYVFLIPQSVDIFDAGDSAKIRWVMSLASGVTTASADVQMDLAPRGNYLSSTDGTTVKVGAVTDASSPAQVHTLFDITLDVA